MLSVVPGGTKGGGGAVVPVGTNSGAVGPGVAPTAVPTGAAGCPNNGGAIGPNGSGP